MPTVEVPIQDRFRIWYEEPLAVLENIDKGNGAILALMAAMPLYERAYLFALSKREPDTNNRPLWVMKDLRLKSEMDAKVFWNAFRDGLCHTGSFFEESDKFKVLPKIGLDGEYPDFPTFIKLADDSDAIIVNPWKLVSHILGKFRGNIPLLEYAPAPLLPLYYLIEDKVTLPPT